MTKDEQKQRQKEREAAFLKRCDEYQEQLRLTMKFTHNPDRLLKLIRNYIELGYNQGLFDGMSVANDIQHLTITNL